MVALLSFATSDAPGAVPTTMDSEAVSIESFSRSFSHRTESIPTIGGHLTRSLGPEATALAVTGVYFPAGRPRTPRSVFSTVTNPNWYNPVLDQWDRVVGRTGVLSMGNMGFGDFTLAGIDYDHDLLLAGALEGMAPRRVRFTVRFTAVREFITVNTAESFFDIS